MGGALYGLVRLTFNTLYPGYKSFKAVKSKNVQDYVRWMMYWIVFAFFTALETLLDPFLLFWFPFYSEIKIVLLLYLVSPVTKGSGVIYRRFLHPLLCQREDYIDAVLLKVKEQGYNTLSSYTTRGLTWLASTILTTAIQGGGTVLNKIKRSYSLLEITDLAELAFRDDHRFQDVTEEMNSGIVYNATVSVTTSLKEMRNRPPSRRRQFQRRDQFQNSNLRLDRIGSTESLSSGYCSDSFLPVQAETMDTQDYELWERQQTRFTPRNTRRGLPSRKDVLSDEEDYPYESIHITTPFGRVNRNTDPGLQSPDVCSSYYPSDKESDEDDLPARIVNNQQTVTSVDRHLELSRRYSRNGGKEERVLKETADSSKTKDRITVEELQKLARRLNCELVTNPTGQEETSLPRPTPPKRFIKSDLNFEEKDSEDKDCY
ncbi:uncharacterized protein LOC111709245 isoform X3 [Eurytemora carolleeae]|uniref:uncharacterized protein LOC111709245 isoform X3 n=1 Tax=Eurytemora carolleeae TaxID=1294199 RepID=UPI000C7746D7|nr:uncharacterized protein LOC111709245 isoform X3 [Eurytemora carolleeae]|eukprot:XP_023338643.1 uncharacterized protein LOC111709245 isoform X3 [Eurytemora affinis]